MKLLSGLALLSATAVTAAACQQRSARECPVDSLTTTERLVELDEVTEELGRVNFPDAVSDAVLVDSTAGRMVSALSWGGPSDGALLLVSCGGQVLDVAKTGYVSALQSMAVVPGASPQVLVEHQSGQGTGWIQHRATVYGVAGDTLRVLWSGVTREQSYQAEAVGAYEITASITHSEPGQIIRAGSCTELEYDESIREWKPKPDTLQQFRETYIWNPQTRTFEGPTK
jgi:hypothetical protein